MHFVVQRLSCHLDLGVVFAYMLVWKVGTVCFSVKLNSVHTAL